MKIVPFALVVAMLALFGCDSNGAQQAPDDWRTVRAEYGERSHDGRFGTECSSRLGGEFTGFFCQVSIFQILGSPERFHGKDVEFAAYAAAMNGRIYLFPTEMAFHQLDLNSAIVVDSGRPMGSPSEKWVRVRGIFSAAYDGKSDKAIGSLSRFTWR